MIGNVAAQVALLAFALALFAGLYAGNSPGTILLRACIALVVGFLVAQTVAGIVRLALREYLQGQKRRLDEAHVADLRGGDAQRQRTA